MSVLRPFVLALLGTSLTTGRLSADWVPKLVRELQTYPEAKGPITILNMGKGSQTSTSWGVPQASLIADLRPNHILTEGFAINDCVDTGGGPAVSRATHSTNLQSMIQLWKAQIPGVHIGVQTMNPVSLPNQAQRPLLADYYADEVVVAALEAVDLIDNYAGWPKPLPQALTNGVGGPKDFSTWGGGTWNPAGKNANVALTGADLVATVAGATIGAVLGVTAVSAGLHYFEATVGNVGGGVCIGVGAAGMSLANGSYVGIDVNGLGYRSDGTLLTNAGAVGALGAYTTGDVIGVARAHALGTTWFSKNGAWLNGDPATLTGGYAGSVVTVYPAASAVGGGSVSGAFNTLQTLGDGLHPIFTGAVDTYLYPNVLAWVRARMAAHWPA